MVYILRIEGTNYYKIGFSKDMNGVFERLKTFQQCFRQDVELNIVFLVYPLNPGPRPDHIPWWKWYGSRDDEWYIHQSFRRRRVPTDKFKHLVTNGKQLTKEWFHIPDYVDIQAAITKAAPGRVVTYDEYLAEVVFDLDF